MKKKYGKNMEKNSRKNRGKKIPENWKKNLESQNINKKSGFLFLKKSRNIGIFKLTKII